MVHDDRLHFELSTLGELLGPAFSPLTSTPPHPHTPLPPAPASKPASSSPSPPSMQPASPPLPVLAPEGQQQQGLGGLGGPGGLEGGGPRRGPPPELQMLLADAESGQGGPPKACLALPLPSLNWDRVAAVLANATLQSPPPPTPPLPQGAPSPPSSPRSSRSPSPSPLATSSQPTLSSFAHSILSNPTLDLKSRDYNSTYSPRSLDNHSVNPSQPIRMPAIAMQNLRAAPFRASRTSSVVVRASAEPSVDRRAVLGLVAGGLFPDGPVAALGAALASPQQASAIGLPWQESTGGMLKGKGSMTKSSTAASMEGYTLENYPGTKKSSYVTPKKKAAMLAKLRSQAEKEVAAK
ncbi:hypothetical protein QJQ45_014123 [Haematococcus lacustris]|nr:hypothetical protein QJQ45_014123 [Haematococcus lacustris]